VQASAQTIVSSSTHLLAVVAAAAARDLLASESSTKTKKKRNKKKKKLDSPEQLSPSAAVVAANPVKAVVAQPVDHADEVSPCSTPTEVAEMPSSVEVAVSGDVHDAELKLLEAMGWSNELNVCLWLGLLAFKPDVWMNVDQSRV
jgi:hypothetical protein